MTDPGLLLDGVLVAVPGVTVIPPAGYPGAPAWNQLYPDDYTARQHAPSIVCLHSTGGNWPQAVIEETRPGGHAREVLDEWSGANRGGGEHEHSGAPIVVDFDGVIYNNSDIVRTAAYHARAINQRAVGIEMCTYPDGSITRATLHATALLVAALTHSGAPGGGLLAIPFQGPRGPYRNAPMRRLETGGGLRAGGTESDGAGLCGVIGHRDQTCQRGYGDPGEAIWPELDALGFERLDFDAGEDLELGKQRQAALNALDAKFGATWAPLFLDGVFGRLSRDAMLRYGYKRWRDVR